ncbi:MAG: DNA polymerase I [Rhizobiales bacterium]|nr:DNA polymerase I [Hyphomicrobiales bacterium]
MAQKHLFLVDGSAYIFRAYHALPPLSRKSDGLPVGAVAGFCNMIWKLYHQAKAGELGPPATHFAVIFDYSSKTFRNEIYPQYKANRSAPPEDLRPQFALIRAATRAFSLPCVEQEGFEADDLIATYARIAREQGERVTVVSSDKDLMQLVNDNVTMYDQMKDKHIATLDVIEKYGVGPEKMIDLQALTGDSTDNVPGIPGIGPKTAAQLLTDFGDLETLLGRAAEIKQDKRRESLIAFADQARLSKRLVCLEDAVPLDVPLEDLVLIEPDGKSFIAFLKGMEFTTLTKRVAENLDMDVNAVAAETISVDGFTAARGPDLDPGDAVAGAAGSAGADASGLMTPQALTEARKDKIAALAFDTGAYETVTSSAALERWIAEATDKGVVAIDTETTSLDAMACELVGVSLATAPGRACYIPLAHLSEGSGDLLGGGEPLADQIPIREVLALLKPLFENPSVLKIAQNLKYDYLVLRRYGIDVAPFDDTMLMSYALDAGAGGGHGMDALAERWLGHATIAFKDVCGSGKSMITFDRVPIEKATAYAAEDADVTLRLWLILKPRLVAEGMSVVYERLERPMVPVLARMEQRGISVDRKMLSRLSGEFAQKAAAVEAEVYAMAGETFNVGSPKQLGDILFGKMGLPGGKKTKTGAWSTSVGVLDDLAAEGHALPVKIVEWRQLSKLKSTYTDAIPTYINPQTDRVHTSYSLASTSTGRLSSSEPNLQNIPVRTEEGRKIRKAFVAAKGRKLLSADYSQIELRVLAHMADIPQLKQAFAEGLDIHAMTASEMFNVPVKDMDPMVRRRAKAINFGIIYGISAFGLANQLGISRGEAKDYIDKYFERFPGIRGYMEATRKFVHAHGYVETIFGRRAHFPDIDTKNPSMRAFYERAAINAPIQGSAADILRRAMLRMEGALEAADLSAQMLLQVHDELIFELPEGEVDATIRLVRDVMENATMPALALSVPLAVDARAADNWDEAH